MRRYHAVSLVLLLLGALLTGCQQKPDDVLVGPNWEALRNLKPGDRSFQVHSSGRESLRVGDPMSYTVTTAQAGKLWVVQVDSHDEVSVLYPNTQVADNTIEANRPLTIPPKGGDWSLEASEPLGKSLVAFLVVTGDTQLDDLLQPKPNLDKALRVVKAAPTWGMATRVVEVQEAKR